MIVDRKRGVILLIITAILWSLGGMLIKGVTWNGIAIAGGRSLVAALTIMCFMGKPNFKFTKARWGAALTYAATVLLFVVATKKTTAANAILLQYTAPIYTALLSVWLLKEKVHKKDIISMSIMLGGMVLFFLDTLAVGNVVGDILALLAGVSFGAMSVFMRMEKDNDPMQATFWGNIFAFIIAIPWMGSLEWSGANIMGILLLGVIQLGLAYVCYSKAIVYVTAIDAALIPIIEPILNPLWVVLATGEVPSLLALVGGSIVVAGAVYRGLPERHQA